MPMLRAGHADVFPAYEGALLLCHGLLTVHTTHDRSPSTGPSPPRLHGFRADLRSGGTVRRPCHNDLWRFNARGTRQRIPRAMTWLTASRTISADTIKRNVDFVLGQLDLEVDARNLVLAVSSKPSWPNFLSNLTRPLQALAIVRVPVFAIRVVPALVALVEVAPVAIVVAPVALQLRLGLCRRSGRGEKGRHRQASQRTRDEGCATPTVSRYAFSNSFSW